MGDRPFKDLQVKPLPEELRQEILAKLDALHELIKGEGVEDS